MSKKLNLKREVPKDLNRLPVTQVKTNDASDVDASSTCCSGCELTASESGSAFKIILRRKLSPIQQATESTLQAKCQSYPQPNRPSSTESVSIMKNRKYTCSDCDTDCVDGNVKYKFQPKIGCDPVYVDPVSSPSRKSTSGAAKSCNSSGFNNGESIMLNSSFIGFKSILSKPLGNISASNLSANKAQSQPPAYRINCGTRCKSGGCDCNCMQPICDQFFVPGCDPCKPYRDICMRPQCKSECSCGQLEQTIHSCCKASNCDGGIKPCKQQCVYTCNPCMTNTYCPYMYNQCGVCQPYANCNPNQCQMCMPNSGICTSCCDSSPESSRKNSSVVIDPCCNYKLCRKRSEDHTMRYPYMNNMSNNNNNNCQSINSNTKNECCMGMDINVPKYVNHQESCQDHTKCTTQCLNKEKSEIDSSKYDVWIVQCPKDFDINGALNRLTSNEGKSVLGKNIEPNVEPYKQMKLFTMYCKVDSTPDNLSFVPAGKIIFKEKDENRASGTNVNIAERRSVPSTLMSQAQTFIKDDYAVRRDRAMAAKSMRRHSSKR